MKKYFISGLGSNAYHSKDFFQELDSQVYFLNPYEKHLRDETELKSWFKNEIVEEESICLIGHSLGGDLARYSASEFEEVKKLILLDGGYLDLDK
ncbi:TPA: alpha/beta hydrolase, partial [Streptococcus pneumoniae]